MYGTPRLNSTTIYNTTIDEKARPTLPDRLYPFVRSMPTSAPPPRSLTFFSEYHHPRSDHPSFIRQLVQSANATNCTKLGVLF
ncbi:hypothetical protein M407DRAFT_96508 [Tulasnella calospora MUT 4182]|uniref:Uncharacterized protein n=1 Tax=Tulasnella calospora MUT 4182 TaxID=1051891 RepID=A0A0C3QK89_9AGAM|nr:hypothetical protein M407DRAFT_96508 [Tulasnella calospora MUT 4182]